MATSLNPEAPEFVPENSMDVPRILPYSLYQPPPQSPYFFPSFHPSYSSPFPVMDALRRPPHSLSVYCNNCFFYLNNSWVTIPAPSPVISDITYLATTEQGDSTKKVGRESIITMVRKGFKGHGLLRRGAKKIGTKTLEWRPKSVSEEDRPAQNLEYNSTQNPAQSEDTETTLMIKNIPNKLSRKEMLDFLDERCSKERQTLISERAAEDAGMSLAYDFLYLPMDFRSRCNRGYAFVNFTSARAASILKQSINNYKWDILGSRKICEITFARIQGKDALIKHFKNSTFVCDSEEFLPVCFIPARDGSGCSVLSCTFGNRIEPSQQQMNGHFS
ncbi:PREDICTED: protein terminal ear1 homolog [Nelumbo nucifera]|uniref:RRM domain-containing protein n=2 Tax=Nelumbo nucifera TaxID=4432 RepID=A0A822ZPV5_NELNU|nr:PREDICTED: protein terminal ear1 homolog [Nelumbo nucifera]DAD46927.1 TPA_asm: hypothetical protein HUJ06_016864 [Nelumbo nucifera]